MKYLGCAYYPEYWGQERVETDAKLMQEAAVNMEGEGIIATLQILTNGIRSELLKNLPKSSQSMKM